MPSSDTAQEKDALVFFAHELKGPASTVLAGLSRLRRSLTEAHPDETEVLEIIEEAARSIVEKIDQLTSLCLDPEAFTPEPVLLQHVLPVFVSRALANRAARPVEIEIAPDLVMAAGNAFFIETIIANLVKNADKYSPPAAPIELKAWADGDTILISVRDHGKGVPCEDLETIFDLFYRSPKDSSSAGGRGIGLYLCRRLVTLMGGRVWAELPAGPGLVVTFSLLVYVVPTAPTSLQ